MAISLGTTAILGIRKEGTVGTEIQAREKIPFTSCTITTDPEYVESESLLGTAGYNDTRIVYKPVTVALECPIVVTTKDSTEYLSSDILMHLALGSQTFGSASLCSQGDTADLSSFTLAISQGQDGGNPSVWAVTGCKVNSMTLSCDAGGALMGSFEILGVSFTNASSTNTPAILGALAGGASVANEYIFSDMVCWLDDANGALVTGNAQAIGNFSLSVTNNLVQNQVSSATPLTPPEAIANGFRDVTLDVSYPHVDSARSVSGVTGENSWVNHLLNDVNFDHGSKRSSCELLFTVGSNSIWIGLPSMMCVNAGANVGGAGALSEDVSFVAYYSHGLSFDMVTSVSGTTVNGAVGIETKNNRTEVFA